MTTEYEYVDGLLMYEKKGDTEVHYAYDGDGNPRYIQTVESDGTVEEGYLVTNTRGDVVAIVNAAGNVVVNYTYDAWGKVMSVTNANGSDVSNIEGLGYYNSLRYRGYYYDVDTGLYYLQSRYYDPQVKRFINTDDASVLEEDQGSIIEHNLFAYCLNNPVNMVDNSGEVAIAVVAVGVGAIKIIEYVTIGGMLVIATCMTAEVGSKLYKKYKSKRKIKVRTFLNSPRTLVDVKAKKPRKNMKVYRVAYINSKGKLKKIGKNLTYSQAITFLKSQSNQRRMKRKYRNWGIYTTNQIYAKALALGVGAKGKPEVQGHGYYGHYHDALHKYHIWYAQPINYFNF